MKKTLLTISALLLSSSITYSVVNISNHQTAFNLAKTYLPNNAIIVDAGSYDGKDAITMSTLWPDATIHAFEPDPENFTKLRKNTNNSPNIFTYSYALSEKNGTAIFHCSEDPRNPGVSFQSGSLLAPKEHLKYADIRFNKKITVPTITLDDWAEKHNIDHIDMLWLDMQGVELNVMKASPKILKTVKIICTEVEFVEAYEGQYMYQEVRTWLEEQGFELVGEHRKYGWFGDILMVRKES